MQSYPKRSLSSLTPFSRHQSMPTQPSNHKTMASKRWAPVLLATMRWLPSRPPTSFIRRCTSNRQLRTRAVCTRRSSKIGTRSCERAMKKRMGWARSGAQLWVSCRRRISSWKHRQVDWLQMLRSWGSRRASQRTNGQTITTLRASRYTFHPSTRRCQTTKCQHSSNTSQEISSQHTVLKRHRTLDLTCPTWTRTFQHLNCCKREERKWDM